MVLEKELEKMENDAFARPTQSIAYFGCIYSQ